MISFALKKKRQEINTKWIIQNVFTAMSLFDITCHVLSNYISDVPTKSVLYVKGEKCADVLSRKDANIKC